MFDEQLGSSPNPHECPCRGTGYWLSDHDAWIPCPHHARFASEHPEEEGDTSPRAEAERAARRLALWRASWRGAQGRSGLDPAAFRAEVERTTGADATRSPAEWSRLAWEVSGECWHEAADARARGLGYSCRLEAALAAEARLEACARSENVDPDARYVPGSPERADLDSWTF